MIFSDCAEDQSCLTEDMFCNSKSLAIKMLIAVIVGCLVGISCHYYESEAAIGLIKPVGETFIRCLRFLLGPLFFSTIFMAIVNLKTPINARNLGIKTLIYYTVSGVVSIALGLVLINWVKPGVGTTLSQKYSGLGAGTQPTFDSLFGALFQILPKNPFAAFYDGNVIQIMFCAFALGVASLFLKKKVQPFLDWIASVEVIFMTLMKGLIYVSPIGIFALIADVTSEIGLSSLLTILKYFLVVLSGIFAYGVGLVLVASLFLRRSPLFVVKVFWPVLVAAFSTCSTSATLPLGLTVTQKNLKITPSTSRFVLSLGTIINISGTALYEAIGVIFLSQIYGMQLDWTAQILVFLVASLSAIGAAAIPSAGMVTMSVILTALHFPLEAIGLVLSVDCILDQVRTAMNVLGDCTGAIVVDSKWGIFDFEPKMLLARENPLDIASKSGSAGLKVASLDGIALTDGLKSSEDSCQTSIL